MLIKSIEVRNYRTIRHAKVDLTAGLNVIHGDNDIGKSTLMDALRSGLVRRGRLSSKILETMCPRDGGHPEVEVRFENGGAEFCVQKKFGPRGSTRLHRRSPGGVMKEVGGDADEELLNVLRFGERVAAGRSTDLGILPLIWVKQGTSGNAPSEVVSAEAGSVLNARLAELSGTVLDGAGMEKVFARVRAEYERHFTPERRDVKSGSPLDQASDARETAQREVADLRTRGDELDGVFIERQRCERERAALMVRMPALVDDAVKANTTWESIKTLLAGRTTATAEATARKLEAQAARGKLATREAVQRAIGERREAIARCALDVDAATERLRTHDAGRDALAQREAMVADEERAADRRLREARARVELFQETTALAALASRLGEAEAIHGSLVVLHGRLGAMRLRATDLDRLAKLERDAETAATALQTVAASIEIVALRDGVIGIDADASEMLAGDRLTRQVAARTALRIGDFAEVVVHPGGRDLAAVREAARAKEAAFRRALEAATVANMAEARAAVDERRDVENEIAVAKARLGGLAPVGVAVLQQEHAAQQAKVRAAEAVLSGASAGSPDAPSIEEARASTEATERNHKAARAACEQARVALAGHDAQRAELLVACGVVETQATGAKKHLADLEAELGRCLEIDGTDVTLAERARAADAQADDANHALAGIEGQLTGIDPETARLRAEAAERACVSSRTDATQLEKEIHGLDARLSQADVLTLDDRLEAAEARLADARAAYERCEEEAESVRLLYETLRDCREEAQERFLAPLATEVQRLSCLLDPTSKVELDPTYGLHLERAAYGSHRFDSLGGGCKEQTGIVVRLAMANMLAGDDTLPVLFDDAMVNTSDARFDRMADVLVGMASRLQIIVFTCHWDRYAALGAHNVVDFARVRSRLEGHMARAG